ncbi:divergent polysaccharide deacetylase family protein, partial [bacterium]|nr:divergent polysaccharide deacetylase family protein [bacterium]
QPTPAQQILIEKEKIFETIEQILRRHGVDDEATKLCGNTRTLQVPLNTPVSLICREIASETAPFRATIMDSYEKVAEKKAVLTIGHQNKELVKLILVQDASVSRIRPKIAIIIDDFGYAENGTVAEFIALNTPLTLSVIPGLPFTKTIAAAAKKAGKTVLIHMPMEPYNKQVTDNGFRLMTTMSAAEIRNRLERAIDQLPEAIGLNNHQGSKAMENTDVVTTLVDKLNEHQLLFVDSQTSSHSVGIKIARTHQLPAIKRDVFLDNEELPEKINKQLERLASIAQKRGYAVGIGHVKPATLAILKKRIPALEKRHFQFVSITDIIPTKPGSN